MFIVSCSCLCLLISTSNGARVPKKTTTTEKKQKKVSSGIYIQSIPEKAKWSPTSNFPLQLLTTPSKDTYMEFEAKICDAISGKRSTFLRANNVKAWKHPTTKFGKASFAGYLMLMYAIEKMIPPRSLRRNDVFLEFGVAGGYSINVTQTLLDGKIQRLRQSTRYKHGVSDLMTHVYGFDWFRGLPEEWSSHGFNSSIKNFQRGIFAQPSGSPPFVVPNVHLISGLFNSTLEPFLKQKNHLSMNISSQSLQVAWLNVDNDLYEGAVYILQHLLPFMKKGGIIHFHDLLHVNDTTFQCTGMDEMKALYDVLQSTTTTVPPATNPIVGIKLEVLPLHSRNREVGLMRVL